MKVSQLCIYPIKGMKSISLKQANVLEKGFENDRRWMLIDDNNKFLSQRNFPQLTLFDVSLVGQEIQISKGAASIAIPTKVDDGNQTSVHLWRSKIDCIEPSTAYSTWFSQQLSTSCKLVYMRKKDPRKRLMLKLKGKQDVSFADGYPYLILGTGSMKYLNQKLKEELPIDRFRANIIFESEEAHIEDKMEKVKIGNVKFQMIKPCARCTVITTDQATGQKNPEPLVTLKTYRAKMNKIYFGMNAVALDSGIISIGDTLSPSS